VQLPAVFPDKSKAILRLVVSRLKIPVIVAVLRHMLARESTEMVQPAYFEPSSFIHPQERQVFDSLETSSRRSEKISNCLFPMSENWAIDPSRK